jgi:TetR/AcrR family transcriptional regulator, fatty acid biosynthesis regulator
MRVSPEKREEKERVRLALVGAALRLAAQHGFASLGLREVARAASIAPTSFYRHFADMEELGLSLIEERVAPLVDALCASASGSEPALSVLDALLASAEGDPELLRFVLAERTGASLAFRKALRAKLALLGTALQKASQGEAERVPAESAEAAVVLLLEACARALDDAQARTDVRTRLTLPLQRLLAPEPPTPRSP